MKVHSPELHCVQPRINGTRKLGVIGKDESVLQIQDGLRRQNEMHYVPPKLI